MLLAVLALVVAGVVAVATTVVARGHRDHVLPVAQDRLGPVLLVPGYGGQTGDLEALAAALRRQGRVVRLVAPADGTGDLRAQADGVAAAARRAMADTGAGSVDLVGFSAGGVVARIYAGGAGRSTVRRVVSLASPQHGTDLAALAGSLGSRACPIACQQLAPGSDLLRGLNGGDETPSGPVWVAFWTDGDRIVVPPDSGALAGALSYPVQSVCPGLAPTHGEVPSTPAVIAMVAAALGPDAPHAPTSAVCG